MSCRCFSSSSAWPAFLDTLKSLSFIQAARWSIIRRLPANGDPETVRLRFPLLYFESNFNGGWEEYIDAFSYTLNLGMWGFWGSSYGFPGALPPSAFKEYIRHTSTRRVTTTPRTRCHSHDGARRRSTCGRRSRRSAVAAPMSAEQFAQAWRDFLTESRRASDPQHLRQMYALTSWRRSSPVVDASRDAGGPAPRPSPFAECARRTSRGG